MFSFNFFMFFSIITICLVKTTQSAVLPFRSLKLYNIFKTFLDTNGDGFIDMDDMDKVISKLANIRDYKEGTKDLKELKKNWDELWEMMKQEFDADNNGKVDFKEFKASWDTDNSNSKNSWQKKYETNMFEYLDYDKTGKITSDEYVDVYVGYGHNRDDAIKNFKTLSSNKRYVKKEDYNNLWTDYFYTDNIKSNYKILFGEISCEKVLQLLSELTE